MRLSGCHRLRLSPVTGTWYRVIPPQFFQKALSTDRTKRIRSRYSPGRLGKPPFAVLYLCENRTIALYEVEAQFKDANGNLVSNPKKPLLHVDVKVVLQRIADLTDLSQQRHLSTNAQELTGDWVWYDERTPHCSVPVPVGTAPTQQLGQALFGVSSLEGFQTISAKMPNHRNLVLFPGKLLPGSFIEYLDPIANRICKIAG